jgi:hypothetical protein
MWMIVALVYIIVAGEPVIDEPIKVNHILTFDTLDKCQAYLKGEEYGDQREELADLMRSTFVAKLEKDAGENADVAPVPGIAITASCEEDKRV